MATYETVFITVPSLTDQEESDLVGSLAQVVLDDGGSIVANDRMGRRRLGYPIRKFDDGVYTRFLYDAEKEVPKELERRIRLSDNVLRCLTVVLEKDWAVAAKQQAERDAQRRIEAAAEAERQAAEAERAAELAATAAVPAPDGQPDAESQAEPQAESQAEPQAESQAEPKKEDTE